MRENPSFCNVACMPALLAREVEGIYDLDVIVYDNVGQSFARKKIPMTIHGGDAK
jgi:hypothetical protein